MTRLPLTSAVPNPASIFDPPTSSTMASTAGPTPTPLPAASGGRRDDGDVRRQQPAGHGDEGDVEADAFELPKLRLNVPDVTHPGASRFLAATNASTLLAQSVLTVLRLLYQRPSSSLPGTRSVTLFLKDMGGVAYTKGSDLDDDHKEIHFSVNYINSIARAPEGSKGDTTGAYEIHGVLVHELVHCFQHNGRGTCPGGLIEGIADWVRLRAHLAPPHWRRDSLPPRWDAGYEKTAYFLEWLEVRFGEGTVRRINETLRADRYDEASFWQGLFGSDIDTLWHDYKKTAKKEGEQ